jgi:hypothetical protein
MIDLVGSNSFVVVVHGPGVAAAAREQQY